MTSADELPDGFRIVWDGQVYQLIAVKAYTRADGKPSQITEWQSVCPSCGSDFTLVTGLSFAAPSRRCQNCKAPGRTVRADRKQFRRRVKGEIP